MVPRCPIPGDASQLKTTQGCQKIDRLNVGVGPWVVINFGTSRRSFMLQRSWALHSCLLTACQAFITTLPRMLLIYFDHMHPFYYSFLSTFPIWRHLSRSQASGLVSIEIPQGGRCT